jgi:uncharacterized protein YjbJ (UPF0337 family)
LLSSYVITPQEHGNELAPNPRRPEAVQGHAKQRWGKLTHDNLDIPDGRREQLAGRIQEAYGISKDEADRQINHWQKSLIEQHAAAITTDRAGAAVHETHALIARDLVVRNALAAGDQRRSM